MMNIFRAEIDHLKGFPHHEEIQKLQSELTHAKTGAHLHGEFESERLELRMRAEKADAKAQAITLELIEVTKKTAKEIATLKMRLAEKDAQVRDSIINETKKTQKSEK